MTVSNDQYLLSKARDALNTIDQDIVTVNNDCDDTLEILRSQVSSTRNLTTEGQTTIQSLQTNIAIVSTTIHSLKQKKTLTNVKRTNAIKQMTRFNLTISNLETKIINTENDLEETQILIGYYTGNETESRDRLLQLKSDLDTMKTQFNSDVSVLNSLIDDAETALLTYVNQKPILELSLQNSLITIDLQLDKLQSYFDQLVGHNRQIASLDETISEYESDRNALNERLQIVNNIIQRTPSNGEIEGTTVVYPYFGSCVDGQPDNCTCYSDYAGTGCTKCSNSSLMNIFYSPALGTDPIFCSGTEIRKLQVTATGNTRVIVPPSNPNGDYGNSVYLPSINITFDSLTTTGEISFVTSGFPPYVPDSFFPFTDYQQIVSVVSFASAQVCYILPNSNYFAQNIAPELINQMSLWRLDSGVWYSISNFVNNTDGSFSACATLQNSFVSNGDWFAIGAQICNNSFFFFFIFKFIK